MCNQAADFKNATVSDFRSCHEFATASSVQSATAQSSTSLAWTAFTGTLNGCESKSTNQWMHWDIRTNTYALRVNLSVNDVKRVSSRLYFCFHLCLEIESRDAMSVSRALVYYM